jgi:hypothetical protein
VDGGRDDEADRDAHRADDDGEREVLLFAPR